MFDSLGPRKYAVPLAFIILIACVMSLVFFPMVHMEPKNLSFAVLSLDEGAETPQGTMNAGETMVNAIVSGEVTQGEESPIVWTKVESQEELDAALENNEYYGALIIPSGFTAAQVAAKQAETQAAAAQAAALMAVQQDAASASADGATSSVAQGEGASADSAAASGAAVTAASDENAAEAPAIKMVADNAKSPLAANLMQSMVGSMFSGTDVSVEVEAIHTGDAQDQTASTNPMGNMMSQQLTIMPTVIMSIVCALFTTRIFKKTGDASARWAALGKQVAFAVALSLLVALAAFCIAALGAESSMPFAGSVLFLWMASLCVMLVFLGLFDIAVPLGALGALLVFACGMACGILPFELLPAFWQDWVFPWAPQRFMGEGIRAILYMGAGVWNAGSGPLLITGVVGAACIALAGLLPAKKAEA